jgi:histone chaperone ASF1
MVSYEAILFETLNSKLTRYRDSEASAPAEFPPEQPEAELVADGDQYGAEEEAEEAELEKEAGQQGEDSEMAGVENENDEAAKAKTGHENEEEEMSEDGSVDLEGESSEDELEEDEEEGAEGAGKTQGGDDAMEVDMADSKGADVQSAKPVSVAS